MPTLQFPGDRSLKFDVFAVASPPASNHHLRFAQTRSQSTYVTAMPGAKKIPTAEREQVGSMGHVHADITLTNMFSRQSVCVRTLVDTGSTHMSVPASIARELGFD